MLDIFKSIIWIVLLFAAAYFVMEFLGYEINKEYFIYSRKKCEERLKECGDNFIHKGIDNCDFKCVDPKLIIKKK